MRTYDPTDEDDVTEAARLKAEPWMLDALALNPEYVFWGPDEDYMACGKDAGWRSAVEIASWAEMGFALDDLNEVVHFYFEVDRASKTCETCGGTGYHRDALWVSESFYRHSSPFTLPDRREIESKAILQRFGSVFHEPLGRCAYPSEEVLDRYGPEFRAFCERMHTRGHWNDDITQDEVEALVAAGRLRDFTHEFVPGAGWQPKANSGVPSADDVNKSERIGTITGSHDGINRHILIKARLARFGVPHQCETCEGHGYVFTADAAILRLVLWVLHPRKGASRGVRVPVQRHELPAAFEYLREAAKRNADRFSKLPQGDLVTT